MDETSLDLKQSVRTLIKRRKVIGNVFLMFVILAAVISFIIPPTFEGEATIRIKQPRGLADSLLNDSPLGNVSATKQQMGTYAEILKSRSVVQTVIDKTVSGKDHYITYKEMLERISTRPVKDTDILRVQVQGKSPVEAQYLTNTLVETFIERLTYLTRSEHALVRQFIGQRMQDSKRELAQAESALEQYKRDQQIVAPADETKAMVERLASLDKLAAENTVNAASANARLNAAKRQLADEKPGFIADSPLIHQYKVKLADLEVQLASVSQNYTERHPQIIAIRAAISETKAKLNTEIARVINAEAPSMNPVHQGLMQSYIQAEAEIAASSAQRDAINSILNDNKQQMSSLPTKEQGLAKLMRDASVAQEIYIMLAKRFEEARISEVMQPTDVQIIDSAIPPEKPISPRKVLNIVIAAIAGLLVGIGYAFLAEYLNKRLRTAEDVKQYLDLPVLGNIPDMNNNQEIPDLGLWDRFLQSIGVKGSRT